MSQRFIAEVEDFEFVEEEELEEEEQLQSD